MITALLIRQSTNLYLWTAVIFESGGTLAATPAATPAVGVIDLDGLAVDWFAEDREGGDLIDMLPTVDLLPEGYSEFLTAENIDELAPDAIIESLSTPAGTPAP